MSETAETALVMIEEPSPTPTAEPTEASELAPAPLPPERVAQVFTWILSGASEQEITEAVQATWPDATEPMPLIVAAMKRIADSAQAEATTIRGWCIEATRLVYQRALEAGDWATALRAAKQMYGFAS